MIWPNRTFSKFLILEQITHKKLNIKILKIFTGTKNFSLKFCYLYQVWPICMTDVT